MTLSVIAPDGSVEAKFGCATGKVPGHKQRRGDMRTPEGRFTISQIHAGAIADAANVAAMAIAALIML